MSKGEMTAVVARIVLGTQHAPTGKTRHNVGESELPPPSNLAIARYSDAAGFYLLYFDEHGNELTDTYHERLEDAMAQANWEFNVKPDEWETCTDS